MMKYYFAKGINKTDWAMVYCPGIFPKSDTFEESIINAIPEFEFVEIFDTGYYIPVFGSKTIKEGHRLPLIFHKGTGEYFLIQISRRSVKDGFDRVIPGCYYIRPVAHVGLRPDFMSVEKEVIG